ncbi:hypothetical protein Tco_1126208 [Tanacetum coccineum]
MMPLICEIVKLLCGVVICAERGSSTHLIGEGGLLCGWMECVCRGIAIHDGVGGVGLVGCLRLLGVIRGFVKASYDSRYVSSAEEGVWDWASSSVLEWIFLFEVALHISIVVENILRDIDVKECGCKRLVCDEDLVQDDTTGYVTKTSQLYHNMVGALRLSMVGGGNHCRV